MKTSTKAAAAERPQAAAAGRRRRPPPQAAAAVRRKQAAWRTAAAAASARGRRRPQAAVHAFFRKGCVNVKYSGATRARSLCFIFFSREEMPTLLTINRLGCRPEQPLFPRSPP